jgi:glycopeptide antibiotics resistance protein
VSNLPALQGLLGRSIVQASVLLVLVVVLAVVRSLRRRGRWRSAATVALCAFAIAVTAVLLLTLRPVAEGLTVRTLHLDPIRGAWGWDSVAWNPVIDNVALFVPVGALATVVWWRRSAVSVWLACVGVSVAIEVLQFVVPTGRVANMADVLANAFGAMVGIVLARLIGARTGRARDPGPRPRQVLVPR